MIDPQKYNQTAFRSPKTTLLGERASSPKQMPQALARSAALPFKLTQGEILVFKKPEFMPVSHWASKNVVVQDGPYAGSLMRRDINPYLNEIMDTWQLPHIKEVVVCGAPQTGKTLAMYCCLAFDSAHAPGTKMLAMPNDDTAGRVQAEKLDPLFTGSPLLRKHLVKNNNGWFLFKNGSNLWISSAQSPADRATITVMRLFIDEESLFPSIRGRNLALSDFRERTRSHRFKRKIMRVSKPVGNSACSIWTAINQEVDELRRYRARCPFCDTLQDMDAAFIVIPKNINDPLLIERDNLARYQCPMCQNKWDDAARDEAVRAGCWQSEVPVERPRRVGFHIPAYLSSDVSLSEFAAARLKAEQSDDPSVKEAFANGYLAEPYEPVEIQPTIEAITGRKHPELPRGLVPLGAAALTLGVDVQKRGFYYTVCAWFPNLAGHVLDHGQLASWDDVTTLAFNSQFVMEDGSPPLALWRGAIDTGGTRTEDGLLTRTEEVYEWVKRFSPSIMHATKGSSHKQITNIRFTSIERYPGRKTLIQGGLNLYIVDAGALKAMLMQRLLQQDHPRPITFHNEVDSEFLKQVASERLVRMPSGKMYWEKIYAHNHYLDTLALNLACIDSTWSPSLSHILEQQRLEFEQTAMLKSQPKTQPKRRSRPW